MYTFLRSAAICGLFTLVACSGSSSLNSEEQAFANTLTQLGNTLIPALQQQANVAMAETPPNINVTHCAGTAPTNPVDPTTGTGAISVAVAIQKLNTAAGPNPGPLAQATILAAFEPNGAQWNWAQEQLETACVAALQDAVNAGKATAADIETLNISTILSLAALAPAADGLHPISSVALNK